MREHDPALLLCRWLHYADRVNLSFACTQPLSVSAKMGRPSQGKRYRSRKGYALWPDLVEFVTKDQWVREHYLTQGEIEAVGRIYFRKIVRLLQGGLKGVNIVNFGVFYTSIMKEYVTTNPRDPSKRHIVPQQTMVNFRLSNNLRRRLNKNVEFDNFRKARRNGTPTVS